MNNGIVYNSRAVGGGGDPRGVRGAARDHGLLRRRRRQGHPGAIFNI